MVSTNLRNPFRRDEAPGFNHTESSSAQSPNKLDPILNRDRHRFILEAVPWPDLDYLDVILPQSRERTCVPDLKGSLGIPDRTPMCSC